MRAARLQPNTTGTAAAQPAVEEDHGGHRGRVQYLFEKAPRLTAGGVSFLIRHWSGAGGMIRAWSGYTFA